MPLNALKNSRQIDMDLVDAQQARRVLDRIVGILSRLFLGKVKRLSAGRVQSVALKLIIDRENEINDFKPEEYWPLMVSSKSVESNNSKPASSAGLMARRWSSTPMKRWKRSER